MVNNASNYDRIFNFAQQTGFLAENGACLTVNEGRSRKPANNNGSVLTLRLYNDPSESKHVERAKICEKSALFGICENE